MRSDFRKNVCFPESFRGNMCNTGANARSSLKKFGVFAKKYFFAKLLRKNRKNMLIVAFSFQPYIRRKKLNKACLA
jgi:hypothetical protein